MSKNKPKAKGMSRGKRFGVLFLALLIFSVYSLYTWITEDDQSETAQAKAAEQVRNCKDWKESYPTVTNIGENGFTVGNGTWVLEVDSTSWKKINANKHTWTLSEYTGTTQTRTPEGSVTSGPGHSSYKDVYNSLEFKGKGCILVTTDKNTYLKWKYAQPANQK